MSVSGPKDVRRQNRRRRIGSQLARARKQAGYSQTRFADLLEIGRATLSRYERGELAIPADILAEALDEFPGATAEDFLGGRA